MASGAGDSPFREGFPPERPVELDEYEPAVQSTLIGHSDRLGEAIAVGSLARTKVVADVGDSSLLRGETPCSEFPAANRQSWDSITDLHVYSRTSASLAGPVRGGLA